VGIRLPVEDFVTGNPPSFRTQVLREGLELTVDCVLPGIADPLWSVGWRSEFMKGRWSCGSVSTTWTLS